MKNTVYRATIEKTGEKVLVWHGEYNQESTCMRWYELNDERDWTDDKFSNFELLSTNQLILALVKAEERLARIRAENGENDPDL